MQLKPFIFLVACAASQAHAGWGYIATLSNNCPGGAYNGYKIPITNGFPNQAQCEASRNQVLSTGKQTVNLYPSGTCTVQWICEPCSGTNDAAGGAGSSGGVSALGGEAQGKAFFSTSQDTELGDWQRQTDERLKVLGGGAKPSMEIVTASTGDPNVDSSLQQQLNGAYGSGEQGAGAGGGTEADAPGGDAPAAAKPVDPSKVVAKRDTEFWGDAASAGPFNQDKTWGIRSYWIDGNGTRHEGDPPDDAVRAQPAPDAGDGTPRLAGGTPDLQIIGEDPAGAQSLGGAGISQGGAPNMAILGEHEQDNQKPGELPTGPHIDDGVRQVRDKNGRVTGTTSIVPDFSKQEKVQMQAAALQAEADELKKEYPSHRILEAVQSGAEGLKRGMEIAGVEPRSALNLVVDLAAAGAVVTGAPAVAVAAVATGVKIFPEVFSFGGDLADDDASAEQKAKDLSSACAAVFKEAAGHFGAEYAHEVRGEHLSEIQKQLSEAGVNLFVDNSGAEKKLDKAFGND
jgi:hypothetical protein